MTKSNNLKWNFGEPQKACTYKLYTKVNTLNTSRISVVKCTSVTLGYHFTIRFELVNRGSQTLMDYK